MPAEEESPLASTRPGQEMGDLIRLKELALREKELEMQKEERAFTLEMKHLEIREKELIASRVPSGEREFDMSRNIRLVPPFNEKDVDKYFTVFERVASSLKWPRDMWSLLLQCVLVGKAREVYSSLSLENCLDYECVKSTVLRAYELVPEAYRHKFRRFRKFDSQTYVEFAWEKEALFDRWCASQGVNDFKLLRALMIMEDFKNCLPERVATYLNEQKVTEVPKAAVLADEYVLTHKTKFVGRSSSFGVRPVNCGGVAGGSVKAVSVPASGSTVIQGAVRADKVDGGLRTKEGPVCYYCKGSGHIVRSCPVLLKKNAKPVVLVCTQKAPVVPGMSASDECSNYAAFITKGFVSLENRGHRVPVLILRDTGATKSFILDI